MIQTASLSQFLNPTADHVIDGASRSGVYTAPWRSTRPVSSCTSATTREAGSIGGRSSAQFYQRGCVFFH
jgi:hypothetical protein